MVSMEKIKKRLTSNREMYLEKPRKLKRYEFVITFIVLLVSEILTQYILKDSWPLRTNNYGLQLFIICFVISVMALIFSNKAVDHLYYRSRS